MKKVRVHLKNKAYEIIIGSGALKDVGKRLKALTVGENAVIITNDKIKSLVGNTLSKILTKSGFSTKFELIPDSEKSKSQAQTFKLINKISQYDIKKKIFIITLGGGVVGDLGGFVAAIYKRGINYVQIPTTLLAQVDSAIGGKVAIDLKNGKNLAGAFYQPRIVISDTSILTSLSRRQIRTGLAEVIKYAIIKDRFLFEYLDKNHKLILGLDKQKLEFIIHRCSLIKAKIVEQDEKESKGIRTILNFGHTIGHAIEAASGYTRYTHGEAVAVGMVGAADIAVKIGLLSANSLQQIKALIEKFGLPVTVRGLNANNILKAQSFDKKFINKTNRFVLPRSIGTVVVREDIPARTVKNAIIRLID
ncbi:3-dehydroquinate synthase [Candidatus Omnitrophota bacterium]